MESIFLGEEQQIRRVYTPQHCQSLAACAGLDDAHVVTPRDLAAQPEKYRGVRWVFSTWGMPALTQQQWADWLPAAWATRPTAWRSIWCRPSSSCKAAGRRCTR